MAERKTRTSLAIDAKGGFLIESSKAAIRVYPHETYDGGIYFEFVLERGDRLTLNQRNREVNSLGGLALPVKP